MKKTIQTKIYFLIMKMEQPVGKRLDDFLLAEAEALDRLNRLESELNNRGIK